MMIRTIRLASMAIFLLGVAAVTHAQPPAHLFFDQLTSLCGNRYVGEMTFPEEGQDSFAGKELVADFKKCNQQQVLVPFSVGEDRSRTWVFTKTVTGVRLKHDHRHADGSPDDVTNYGGDSNGAGGAFNQSFAADSFTQKLIPAASTNIWSVSISEDKQQLTYHLTRHQQPRFTAVLHKQPIKP